MRIIALAFGLRDKLINLLPESLTLVSCEIQDKLFDSLAWSPWLDVHCEGRWRRGGEGGGRKIEMGEKDRHGEGRVGRDRERGKGGGREGRRTERNRENVGVRQGNKYYTMKCQINSGSSGQFSVTMVNNFYVLLHNPT